MKYSIVMPVYGVEKYLGAAVGSVLAQTLGDFELILVDDCSPDRCPALCDEWAKKDGRVRVIHKPENEGLGKARNTGLAEAKGRYVLFMDSDDRILPDTLQSVDAALDAETDVLVFGVLREHENEAGEITKTETLVAPAQSAGTPEETAGVFLALNEAHIFPFAWNKVYSRAFLTTYALQFEPTPLIEDFLFNIDVFGKTTHIRVLDKALYRYRKPAHETLVSRYHPEFFDLCKRKYLLEREFLTARRGLTPEAQNKIAEAHLKHVLSVTIRNRSEKAKLSGKEQRVKIRYMLNDPITREALAVLKPHGLPMSVLAVLARCRFVFLWYCAGVAAQFLIKKHNPF